jgi:hypothetical protein
MGARPARLEGGQEEETSSRMMSDATGGLRPGEGGGEEADATEEGAPCTTRMEG